MQTIAAVFKSKHGMLAVLKATTQIQPRKLHNCNTVHECTLCDFIIEPSVISQMHKMPVIFKVLSGFVSQQA